MKKIPIKIPYGIKYISKYTNYDYPLGHCIVDKGITGCGYTEYCLTNNLNIVLCSPRKLLLENKADQHWKDPNILYLENDIENYSDSKSFEQRIKDHISYCNGPFKTLPCKFLVTYDSAHRVIKVLREMNLLYLFNFVVDEFQSIFLDSYFKSFVELDFVESLKVCPNVLYLSATPMLEKYLNRLPEFKDLDFYELDWKDTGYTEEVTISRKLVRSLTNECSCIIENYKSGKFPVTLNSSGEIIYSTEAVFYFNSISDISKVIKKNKLNPSEVLILCSKSDDTKKKLDKLSKELGFIPDVNGFVAGKVPKKNDPNNMFTFCTSAVYMGIDLYSTCASSYVFADPNIDCLALDISLDLPQIVGRQRDKNNPFKNNINLFYRIKRKGEKQLSEIEFELLQGRRREATNKLLSLFSKATEGEKQEYLQKLKRDSEMYQHDFVSISKHTNLPVYNYLIDISNERAWEVSQKDYQDKISVTKSLEEQGFKLQTYQNENEEIAQDFLDNHFYNTRIFEQRLRLYCEFVDIHKNNSEIMNILNHKITNPRFKQFYDYFGTSGCSANSFKEASLLRAWGNDSKEDKLSKEISDVFQVGEKYTMKDMKEKLSEIYQRLGITKTPKATELGNYFDLHPVSMTVNKKRVNGFKLYEKLG